MNDTDIKLDVEEPAQPTFESTETFVEETVVAPTPEPTPEQAYETEFLGVDAKGQDETAEPPKPKWYETVEEAEFQDLMAKARQVDELNARLQKRNDSLSGRLGGIEQLVKELKQQPPPSRTPVPVDKSQLKRLAAYFDGDDDLVQALAEDLSELQLGVVVAPSLDVDARVAQLQEEWRGQLDSTRRDYEMKLLSLQHPDWKDLSGSSEFAAWQQTLKPEDQQRLQSTWDAVELSLAFTKFKDWQSKKAEFEAKKQQRLEEAVAPTQGGAANRGAPPDNWSAFERAFYDK